MGGIRRKLHVQRPVRRRHADAHERTGRRSSHFRPACTTGDSLSGRKDAPSSIRKRSSKYRSTAGSSPSAELVLAGVPALSKDAPSTSPRPFTSTWSSPCPKRTEAWQGSTRAYTTCTSRSDSQSSRYFQSSDAPSSRRTRALARTSGASSRALTPMRSAARPGSGDQCVVQPHVAQR